MPLKTPDIPPDEDARLAELCTNVLDTIAEERFDRLHARMAPLVRWTLRWSAWWTKTASGSNPARAWS